MTCRNRIKHVRIRSPAAHFPSDRLEKMGFPQTNRRMKKQRIDARRTAHHRFGSLHGRRMCQTVRRSNDKVFKGVVRVEGRAIDATGRDARRNGRRQTAGGQRHANALVGGRRLSPAIKTGFRPLRLGGVGDDAQVLSAGLAQLNVNPFRALEFDPATGQQIIDVVRLYPVAQELHRHGCRDRLPVEAVEVERLEPARVNVIPEPCLESSMHFLAASFFCRLNRFRRLHCYTPHMNVFVPPDPDMAPPSAVCPRAPAASHPDLSKIGRYPCAQGRPAAFQPATFPL